MVRFVFRHQDPINERFARPATMVSCVFATFLINKYIYINIYCLYVIMNRHGYHNILNGTVWVQTGHGTCTLTAAWCVIEL